jgi:hypothetical protein
VGVILEHLLHAVQATEPGSHVRRLVAQVVLDRGVAANGEKGIDHLREIEGNGNVKRCISVPVL